MAGCPGFLDCGKGQKGLAYIKVRKFWKALGMVREFRFCIIYTIGDFEARL